MSHAKFVVTQREGDAATLLSDAGTGKLILAELRIPPCEELQGGQEYYVQVTLVNAKTHREIVLQCH